MNTAANILSAKLEKIKRVFDIDKLLRLHLDKFYVQHYYKINRLPYTIFHNRSDLVHMGISRDGAYRGGDLLEQARIVERYVRKVMAKKVLELATGRGANSSYLAKRYANILFYGLDFSKAHLALALVKAREVKNYFPESGDFHDLSRYRNKSIDVVFIVEAFCYSTDKLRVLLEAHRILRPGGYFIICEPYRGRADIEMTETEKLSVRLTELGMAMPKQQVYDDFLNIARKALFTIEFEEDVSKKVIPTMLRFEKLAEKFFDYPRLASFFSRLLPKPFINNAISGYLMPILYEMGLATYYITVLKKSQD